MLEEKVLGLRESYDGPKAITWSSHMFTAKAGFVLDLLKTNAVLMGVPDGEDSAGRQRLKVIPPDELAVRACEIAEHTFNEFARRGWFTKLPEPSPEYVERLISED